MHSTQETQETHSTLNEKTKRGWPKQGSVPIDLLVGQFCACNQESTGTTFSTFTATSVVACFMENIWKHKRPLTVSINRHNNLFERQCLLIFHVDVLCMVHFAIDFDCYPYEQQSEFETTMA